MYLDRSQAILGTHRGILALSAPISIRIMNSTLPVMLKDTSEIHT